MTPQDDAHDDAAPLNAIGAAVASLLALAGLAIAWSTDFVGCLDDETCDDRTLLRAQLMLAIVGGSQRRGNARMGQSPALARLSRSVRRVEPES